MGKLVLVVAAAFVFGCALMVWQRLWERRMRRRRAAQWAARERLLDRKQPREGRWPSQSP
jgi:hypothetical protein